MDKSEELRVFLEASEDLLNSKYILADIKIVNLLKSVASSQTLLALFKNALSDFDYEDAKAKYFVKDKYFSSAKCVYSLPVTSKEILAFTFSVIMDIDAKNVNFGEFLSKYFYVDGSFSASYSAFLDTMIKPFVSTVKKLMDSVIEGKLQDPLEALSEEEALKEQKRKEEELRKKKDKELSEKKYGESVKTLRQILVDDKTKVNKSRLKETEKKNLLLIIDAFANAIESNDKDVVWYSFVSYVYATKAHPFLLFLRRFKVKKLINGIINEL